MTPYRIETPRLLIREWQPQDRPAFARMATDPEMMRYITGGEAMPAERIDGFFGRQQGHLEACGLCMGAMVLRASGEIVGTAGAQPLDRLPGHDLGWWVWKDHWRRGYATEAAAAIRDHALRVAGLPRIHAVIDPDNHASRGVAGKIGMRLSARTTADRTASWRPPIDVLVYTIDAAAAPP